SDAAGEDGSDSEGLTKEDGTDSDIPDELPVDADWGDVFDDLPAQPRSGDDEELREFMEANRRAATGLYEHLLEQARAAPFTLRQTEIAAFLIDAVDDDGYLREWDE